MAEFYARLRSVKEFHRSHPEEPAMSMMDELLSIKDMEIGKKLFVIFNPNHWVIFIEIFLIRLGIDTRFSGDESFGRFLDLNSSHSAFINLKNIENIDYLSYLDQIATFEAIPNDTRKTAGYLKYLEDLCFYFDNFLDKAKPLIDLKYLNFTIDQEFGKLIENGSIKANPFYCATCSKSFEKESVYQAHLLSPKHIKKESYSFSNAQLSNGQNPSREITISKFEFRIHYIIENVLLPELSSTKGNIERKQSSTASELESRRRQIDGGNQEETEELDTNALKQDLEKFEAQLTKAQEEKLYNPLKLPLGWDGKPIPYWLYKLHGLGVSYTCEICGNYIYMGRRVFDKHFQVYYTLLV